MSESILNSKLKRGMFSAAFHNVGATHVPCMTPDYEKRQTPQRFTD